MLGDGEERAGLLAEELEEVRLREAARGGGVVVRDLEGVALGAVVVALFDARDDEDRARGAAAELPVDVEAAERAPARQPRGEAASTWRAGSVGAERSMSGSTGSEAMRGRMRATTPASAGGRTAKARSTAAAIEGRSSFAGTASGARARSAATASGSTSPWLLDGSSDGAGGGSSVSPKRRIALVVSCPSRSIAASSAVSGEPSVAASGRSEAASWMVESARTSCSSAERRASTRCDESGGSSTIRLSRAEMRARPSALEMRRSASTKRP